MGCPTARRAGVPVGPRSQARQQECARRAAEGGSGTGREILSGRIAMPDQNRLYLRQAQLGPMANFVYLIGDSATKKAAVVDPAWDVDAILDTAGRDGYEIDKILITHYHPDHLGGSMMGHNVQGAADMLHRVKVKVYVNKNEAEG